MPLYDQQDLRFKRCIFSSLQVSNVYLSTHVGCGPDVELPEEWHSGTNILGLGTHIPGLGLSLNVFRSNKSVQLCFQNSIKI